MALARNRGIDFAPSVRGMAISEQSPRGWGAASRLWLGGASGFGGLPVPLGTGPPRRLAWRRR